MSRNHLKEKLAAGETTLGLWITLESPTITEIATMLELDWVVIDAEHGHLDFKEVIEHLRIARNTATTALVRIQETEQGLIKRILDIGAQGIIVPQITSAEEVERAVRFAKYPPWGIRGVGGERATAWGAHLKEATRTANEDTMVIPMMETVAAGDAIDAILDIRGVDALFFGPADYSASAGHLGDWEGPGVAERLLEIKDRIRSRGVASGIMGTDLKDAQRRGSQGFQMVGIASDTGLIIRAVNQAKQAFSSEP